MKKNRRIILFIIVVITLFSASISHARNRGKLLFSKVDPAYDDYGNGEYRYPTDSLFQNNPGIFDLRKFELYDEGDVYRFELEFRNRILRNSDNIQESANGFFFLMADIYIDENHLFGRGHQRTITGRDVKFRPENGWEKVVLISPLRDYVMEDFILNKSEDLGLVKMKDDIVIPHSYRVESYKLKVRVEKNKLGNYSPLWGFQVMIMGYDGDDRNPYTFFNIPVKLFAGPRNFGGGSNSFGAPGVLDILTPKGESQKEILSNYSTHPNHSLAKFAYVPMCYSKKGKIIADIKTKMKLPGIKIKPKKYKNKKLAEDEDKFLSKLKKEGFIMPVDDIEKTDSVRKVRNRRVENIVKEKHLTLKNQNIIPVSKKEIVRKNNKTKKFQEKEIGKRVSKRGIASIFSKFHRKEKKKVKKEKRSEEKFLKMNSSVEDDNILGDFDSNFKKYLKEKKNDEKKRNRKHSAKVKKEIKKKNITIFGKLFGRKSKKNRKKISRKKDKNRIKKVEKIVKKTHKHISQEDKNRILCAKHAKELIKMAEKYHKVYPDDKRISISDLRGSGILKGSVPRCPSGGRYVIVTNGDEIEVECLNINGTGHGTIRK